METKQVAAATVLQITKAALFPGETFRSFLRKQAALGGWVCLYAVTGLGNTHISRTWKPKGVRVVFGHSGGDTHTPEPLVPHPFPFPLHPFCGQLGTHTGQTAHQYMPVDPVWFAHNWGPVTANKYQPCTTQFRCLFSWCQYRFAARRIAVLASSLKEDDQGKHTCTM